MDGKTKVVKFNVGGTRYEVARSLLEAHPDTMLTRMASDQWHDDPEAEIFIERDGEHFKYCLSYLRDKKVLLPITIRKEAVLEDLKYYNIEVENENVVEYDAQEKIDLCSRAMLKGYQGLKEEMDSILDAIQRMEIRRDWLDLAMEVYGHLTQSSLHSSIRRKGCFSSSDVSQNGINIDREALCEGKCIDQRKELARVWNLCKRQNDDSPGKEYFKRLGLDLIGFEGSYNLKLRLK